MLKSIAVILTPFWLLAAAPAALSLDLAIIGDAGDWNENTESVQKSIEKAQVRGLVLPGDNLYKSTYKDVWGHWPASKFLFEVVAIGNHNGGYAKEIEYFKMPGEYFSKVIDSSRFVVLNSDNVGSAPEQAEFLERELTAAKEPFVFVVYHHPTYTLSRTHSSDEKKKFQMAVRPLLKKFRSKITALLVGHDHLALVAHFDDLPVILSGAAKEIRRDGAINGVEDGVKVSTDWMFDRTAYWARLRIPARAKAATVEFIRASDDNVSCSVSLTTGARAVLASSCQGS